MRFYPRLQSESFFVDDIKLRVEFGFVVKISDTFRWYVDIIYFEKKIWTWYWATRLPVYFLGGRKVKR